MAPTRPSGVRLLRGAALLSALYLTAGMLLLLPEPGNRLSRLALVAAAVVLAWLGVLGVVRERTRVAEVAALGLAVLGIWQAVAWVFMLPTGAVLAVAAAVLARGGDGDDSDPASDDDGVGDDTDTDDAARADDDEASGSTA